MEWVHGYFKNDAYPEIAQILASFALGILFAPWSWGPLYFITFLIAYEIVCGYFTRGQAPYWRLEARVGILFASILGFIIGRTLVGHQDPFR